MFFKCQGVLQCSDVLSLSGCSMFHSSSSTEPIQHLRMLFEYSNVDYVMFNRGLFSVSLQFSNVCSSQVSMFECSSHTYVFKCCLNILEHAGNTRHILVCIAFKCSACSKVTLGLLDKGTCDSKVSSISLPEVIEPIFLRHLSPQRPTSIDEHLRMDTIGAGLISQEAAGYLSSNGRT